MKRAMRLSFELDREDNPPLYDELMRFPKGTRRVNRLRTLAHEGLMAQSTRCADDIPAQPARPAAKPAPPKPKQDEAAQASLELFGPPLV